MRNNILDLNYKNANNFFLKQNSYITADLPPYFTFEKILLKLSKKLNKCYLDESTLNRAKQFETVDHVICGNKDGRYAWRKIDLINPLIYVSLVNLLTKKENWKLIKTRFFNLKCTPYIKCLSIPILPDSNQTQKATQINEWVDKVDKESIRLSLSYEYYFQTDISNCYGSIYTHSIAWALHEKNVCKKNRQFNQLLGNKLDCHLQSLSNGQTNGIPQGSIVMDFMAEILLAYADKKILEKIDPSTNKEFRILRYRDDYRIFTKNPILGENIIKIISEVLMSLGLHLNTSKTVSSNEIILSSIKPDKKISLYHSLPKKISQKKLRDELLIIYDLGKSFPNSGSIKTRLSYLYEKTEHKPRFLIGQEEELLAILINIGLDNPVAFPIVAAFISKIIINFKRKKKIIYFKKISKKIRLMPNCGFSEIWLQRISLSNKINVNFTEKMCKYVKNNKKLFKTKWIKNIACKKIIDSGKFVDIPILSKLDKTIPFEEIKTFNYYDLK